MWKQSVWSSTISAKLANKHLKCGGVLVLPGAQPAVKGTPGMMGYGMAKAAVHQLTKSLAEPKSGLPKNAQVSYNFGWIRVANGQDYILGGGQLKALNINVSFNFCTTNVHIL